MKSRGSKKKPRLIKAGKLGYCFGVRRAMDMAHKALDRHKSVCSLGSVIHNPQAVKELTDKGLEIEKRSGSIKSKTVLIPSHGAEPGLVKRLKKKKKNIINATCPRVINSQRLAKSLKDKGYSVIIIGDKRHPEVISLKGMAEGSVVVENKNEVRKKRLRGKNLGVIVQTTQSKRNFSSVISELLKKDFDTIEIINTLCNETSLRQEEAAKLSVMCDLIIVVGGYESANTRRLAEISKKNAKTFHIQTRKDLRPGWFKGVKKIGLLSGTSTPDRIIEAVSDGIREIIK
jgi:4-hydroxy-3-methylbut-2-enyl diphosphate reductase